MQNVTLLQLKARREAMGWTQDMLRDASAVSVRTIQRIESGGHTSVETAKSLAGALNLHSYAQLQADPPAPLAPEPETAPPSGNETVMDSATPTQKRKPFPWATLTLLLFVPATLAALGMLLHGGEDASMLRHTGWLMVSLIATIFTMFSFVRLAKAVGAWHLIVEVVYAVYGRSPGPMPAPEPIDRALLYAGMAATHSLAIYAIIIPALVMQDPVVHAGADTTACTTSHEGNTRHAPAEFTADDVPVGLSQDSEPCPPSGLAAN